MKPLHDQDHYQVLELARSASADEIERAYRVARDTYDTDSIALYSVFGDRDAEVIRERVDEAYRVLMDPVERSAYDAQLLGDQEEQQGDTGQALRAAFDATPRRSSRTSSEAASDFGEVSDALRDLEADVEEESGDFDGAKLRRARMRRGFDLDDIADITKVSTTNLRHIEEENFGELPATVYVRGFVTAYARTIGLDAIRVATSYVSRVDQARADQGRGRFLGRR